MKKTKVFITMGTLLLAGIGAFAAKMAYAPSTYWYTSSGGACVSTTLDKTCTTGGTGCTSIQDGEARQLFTTNSGGECEGPLRLEP